MYNRALDITPNPEKENAYVLEPRFPTFNPCTIDGDRAPFLSETGGSDVQHGGQALKSCRPNPLLCGLSPNDRPRCLRVILFTSILNAWHTYKDEKWNCKFKPRRLLLKTNFQYVIPESRI